MSADNYAICPRCQARIVRENQDAVEQAKTAYGKVSPEEY